jgi:hypothetical protein
MAIDRSGTAPYAPASSVLDVIMARRADPTLTYFDNQMLEALGIRESLVPRTAQALRLLDLLTDDGFVTSTFDRVVSAPPGELPSALEKLVRRAYKPIFEDLDPTVATASALEEAFAHFQPPGQRSRMVSMFQGLMRAANMTGPDDAPALRASGLSASNTTVGGAARSAAVSKAIGNGAVAASRTTTNGVLRSVSKASSGRANHWTHEADALKATSPSVARHSLKLNSGGSVDISLDVDLFSLSKADRDFVMDLIDRVSEYTAAAVRRKLPPPSRRE